MHRVVIALLGALMCLSVSPLAAGPRPAPVQSQPKTIELAGGDPSHTFGFEIQPLPDSTDHELVVVLVSLARQCRYPEVFEVPVRLGSSAFQLKRMVRLAQRRDAGGVCAESLATTYRPVDFHYVITAPSVVMYLPTGPLTWSDEAMRLAQSLRTAETIPYPSEPDGVRDVALRLIAMSSGGQSQQAREAAEAVAPLFVSRPPKESLLFYTALAMARRATNDLTAAASAYEVAAMIAAESKDLSELSGVVFDNLATVRRLQRDFTAATAASDRALEILGAAGPESRAYGGALNNRALLLGDQGLAREGVAYSERALAVLRIAFKNDPGAMAPFLEDNRRLREMAQRR